jgi:hypothetical protein
VNPFNEKPDKEGSHGRKIDALLDDQPSQKG